MINNWHDRVFFPRADFNKLTFEFEKPADLVVLENIYTLLKQVKVL